FPAESVGTDVRWSSGPSACSPTPECGAAQCAAASAFAYTAATPAPSARCPRFGRFCSTNDLDVAGRPPPSARPDLSINHDGKERISPRAFLYSSRCHPRARRERRSARRRHAGAEADGADGGLGQAPTGSGKTHLLSQEGAGTRNGDQPDQDQHAGGG